MPLLHFEVTVKQGVRSDHSGSVKKPNQYPCFALVFNNNWNDYDYFTWFGLHYFAEEDKPSEFIGELKVMYRDAENTFEKLSPSFDGRLDPELFCSLGLSTSYYKGIHDKLRPLGLDDELLHSLCDCAYDIEIRERFERSKAFQDSLLRDLCSEKALNEASFILSGKRSLDAYSFCYHYVPRYDNTVYTDWKVKLQYHSPSFLRNIGIIGENGVGKTQMLSQLLDDVLKPTLPNFDSIPLFNCYIAICSTPLDQYNRVRLRGYRKPYAYCCLLQNSTKTTSQLIRAIRRIQNQGKTLYNKPLILHYANMIKKYLGASSEGLFTLVPNDEDNIIVDEDRVRELVSILSSGQLHIFLLITYICANIHMSSLLVIDEPEVHLHPRFIVEFMRTLGEILEQFDSFAIIATHSPLVIREIVNSQVYLMQCLEGGIPQIAPVPFDTFGEDATQLYRNIFGYDERCSNFTQIVRTLIKDKSYEVVVDQLEKYMNLSMSARLAIRDIAAEEAKKNS